MPDQPLSESTSFTSEVTVLALEVRDAFMTLEDGFDFGADERTAAIRDRMMRPLYLLCGEEYEF